MFRRFSKALQNYATKLRIHSVEATTQAGSGHPTSCSSLAEIFSVLYFHPAGLRYFSEDPGNFCNDRLVLSKGHSAPLLYASACEAGLIPLESLKTMRKVTSDLEGHPTPRLSFVDVASGSLGQGISSAVGMAYCSKYFEDSQIRVFAILGDGECAEGSVWEAFNFAGFYKLDNLCAVIDVNRLGQSEETMCEHNLEFYKSKAEAFGWEAICIDGHNIQEIISALETVKSTKGKPSVIIAKTIKGKDFLGIQNELNWHGKPLGDKTESVISYLKSQLHPTQEKSLPQKPLSKGQFPGKEPFKIQKPRYTLQDLVATRTAYGEALSALGSDSRIVSLDADTKNSTMAYLFKEKHPKRFIECYIAEQNMVGAALGVSKRGKVPFVSTFGAFLTRAFDQVRMCGLSWGNVKFVGSHCGVSIGEDGASQMGLEDLAMFRSVPNSLVLYPSDAVSTYKAVELAANHPGVAYIRTSRPSTPVIYSNSLEVVPGQSIVVKESSQDKTCVVAGGVTLHEALKAYEELQKEGINVRVVDMFSVKPVDLKTLSKCSEQCGSILVVEDHYLAGGMFEAVCSALAPSKAEVHGLCVEGVPRSGKPEELLSMFGISSSAIKQKLKDIIKA